MLFNDALQKPLNDIVAGRASLRMVDGMLMAATASEKVREQIDELALSECGFWLLVHLAKEPLKAGSNLGTWHAVNPMGDRHESPVAGKNHEIGG